MKNEIKLIEKVFNDKQVRTIWNQSEEFATLTNILTKIWSGYTVKEINNTKD